MKAYVFPGQGAQFVGMGKVLYESSAMAQELFEKANEILGFRITDIMFDGSDEELRQTRVTQPAVFLHSVIACLCAIENGEPKPDCVAGHSLGEFSALVVAGALSFEGGLRLVAARAQAMQKACELQESTMAAVLALDDETISRICAEVSNRAEGSGVEGSGIVVPANFNCPGQVVISGNKDAVKTACKLLKEAGAKRALPLPVGGAFHSPLMEPARVELAAAIEKVEFKTPICPIYQNVDGLAHTNPMEIKNNLLMQLTAPVRWTQEVQNMLAAGMTDFREFGPGEVLTGLIGKIRKSIENKMGQDQPILVAIHCLVYNHEPYLRDCLEGFVMQKTHFRFVAIVHEDCSTDGSAAIIREYETKYPEIIRPIYETENQWHKPDGSLGRIMDAAIDATGCKYVAFCEGDDYWTDPLKLQKQVDFLESHEDVGLCYTDYGKCADTNKPYIVGAFTNGAADPPRNYEEFLLENSYIAPMTWMYRREVWKTLDLDWVRTDGTLVWALEFYMKSQIAYLPDITAVYREHWGSASAPITETGFMRQYGGVLRTELEFVERYKDRIPAILEDKIRSKGYIDLLSHALLAEDEDFIEEVKNYFEGKGIHFPQLLSMAEQLNVARAQASHAWNSKAYKLGRAILNPIKRLRRK